jgi:peptidoglycan/xylan/chitin deacetylase (PgdA/CDA1 family)
MKIRSIGLGLLLMLAGRAACMAEDCPGNPNALGTSRVMTVDPQEHRRIGTKQYADMLPLDDHEVVLTFDDGPIPPATPKILDLLAAECVKATFFIVGEMARAYPQFVKRAFQDGHTIGTHTEHHPHLNELSAARGQQEIARGIDSTAKALGSADQLAPFFRFPYLDSTPAAEAYVLSRGLMIWSVDIGISDWYAVKPEQLVKIALSRLEAKQRGVILLHDIQQRTAAALPSIFMELKKRGYRVVHVVPARKPGTSTASLEQDEAR